MSTTLLQAARLLIERYGDTAERAAAERASAYLDEGDTIGAATWLRFADAIREVQDKAPAAVV